CPRIAPHLFFYAALASAPVPPSLHDALPISHNYPGWREQAAGSYISGFKRAYESNRAPFFVGNHFEEWNGGIYMDAVEEALKHIDRKSTRLNSSHVKISYAVFCLKKKIS